MKLSSLDRLIAVGDIHGQADLLHKLLRQIAPQASDQLVFLGDYIDRGPAACEVLETLISLRRRFPATVFLRGNHEQMFLDARRAAFLAQQMPAVFQGILNRWRGSLPAEIAFYLDCGGKETVRDYAASGSDAVPSEVLRNCPDAHVAFLEATRMFYRRDPYLFVHAGVDPQDPRGEGRGAADLLWLRHAPWRDDPDWMLTVVHGHTPVREPQFNHLEVILDTGAGHQGPLSACDLLSGQIWQANPESRPKGDND